MTWDLWSTCKCSFVGTFVHLNLLAVLRKGTLDDLADTDDF